MLHRSSCWVLAVVACVSLLAGADQTAAEEGQEGAVWDLGTQPTGIRRATTVSAFNVSCRGKRDFEIELEGEARRFLKITGPTRLDKIARGQSKTTPAELDLNGVPAGVYNEGAIVVRCLNCPPNCRQDRTRIAVHLTVTAPGGGASAPGVASSSDAGGGGTGRSGAPTRTGSGTTASTPGGGDSTRARKPCPEDTSPCDELKARADAAREAAAAARRAADTAERERKYDEQDADWTDEDIERDREQARILRRQAADWRKLAEDSRRDAGINRDRANQWPKGHKYRAEWERDAAADEGWARDRDARAERLEKEAEKLEEPMERRRSEAEEQRTRADRLRAEANAKQTAAEDAQAAYEACLQRLKEECERRRRNAELAELARIAAESRAREEAAAAAAARAAAADAAANDPGRAFLPGYESLVPRLSPFCKWATFEVPREALVTDVRLVAASRRDDPSALEIRTTSAVGTTIGFQYHCKKTSGSAVVAFTQSSGNNAKRYKLRIGCMPDD